ncbi:MAG: hypothetical protein HY006_04290 [Candidatus Sungbacteria bacterium]|nr:hypothetical protein [Candidatus Sungbacteria bacterium]
MDTLFSSFGGVASADLDAISGVPELFGLWCQEGLITGKLHTAACAIIKAGEVADGKEALAFLMQESKQIVLEQQPRVTLVDLEGKRTSAKPLRVLERFVSDTAADDANADGMAHRMFGILSHGVLARILEKRTHANRISAMGSQLLLPFCQEEQLSFPPESRAFPWVSYADMLAPNGRLCKEALLFLRQFRKDILAGLGSVCAWSDRYRYLLLYANVLIGFAGIFVDKSSLSRFLKGTAYTRYLFFLTLLTWMDALIRTDRERRRVLFLEIPVFHPDGMVNGGRIDALELVAVRGKSLTQRQLEILERIGRWVRDQRPKGLCIGLVVQTTVMIFGQDALFEVRELKIGIGDAVKGTMIEPSQVFYEPLPPHLRQVERYLAFGSVDIARVMGRHEQWSDEVLGAGKIDYRFYSGARLHDVSLAPQDRKRFFARNVVKRLDAANQRARLRIFERHLLARVVEVIAKHYPDIDIA